MLEESTNLLAPEPTRILLLDHDPHTLELLLEHYGSEVVTFTDAQEALSELHNPEVSIDIIFLDVDLPGMDSIEFVRRLLKCPYAGSVVLVGTAEDCVLEGIEKHIDEQQLCALAHLHKPVKPDELTALIERLASSRTSAAPRRSARHSYTSEELRTALDYGQLINYYQPKVDLVSGTLVGVESLVRWQNPLDGLVFPDQFLDLAADCGLIRDVTCVVLESALAQSKTWRQAGYQVPIAVNVSMDDLSTLEFPDVAEALAESAGVEPGMVTLEVTEGQAMRHMNTAMEVMTRLRLRHFRLAMDDFGTGNTSLSQLRNLPFDEFKVDRGFVNGASGDSSRRAICDASIRMAHKLDLRVVAEGIENKADWDMLLNLGCDEGQGYLVGHPMPAADFMQWLARWAPHTGIQPRTTTAAVLLR